MRVNIVGAFIAGLLYATLLDLSFRRTAQHNKYNVNVIYPMSCSGTLSDVAVSMSPCEKTMIDSSTQTEIGPKNSCNCLESEVSRQYSACDFDIIGSVTFD